MKLSIYNHLIENGKEYILYNANTDGILTLNSEIKDIILANKDRIDTLENIHPNLFEALKEKKFIVNDCDNEYELLLKHWEQEDTSESEFGLIINPTLNCNLNCWYCYEKHSPEMNMPQNVVDNIKKLLAKKTENDELKRLYISFFGGEPLLKYKDVVKPIAEYASLLCSENNIELFISFTTNGTLLSETVATELASLKPAGHISYQITIDGNQELHDRTRGLHPSGKGTYELIVKNIKRLLDIDARINVRFNYTSENAPTFVDVLDSFVDVDEQKRKNLTFDFHKVWQETESIGMEKRIEEVKSWFCKDKQNVELGTQQSKQRCYADKKNHIVVNYTGDVFKCTAMDFLPDLREGILKDDGTIEMNSRYEMRMKNKYKSKVCSICSIFPICHRGCTRNSFFNKETCLFNESEENKQRIALGRIKWLIKEKRSE